MDIKGVLVDTESRCVHWHSPLDIVALKFRCCDQFYACFSCHEELAGHTVQKFDLMKKPNGKYIICGVCKHQMSFREYRVHMSCSCCGSEFNPMCKLHYHLYFDNADAII